MEHMFLNFSLSLCLNCSPKKAVGRTAEDAQSCINEFPSLTCLVADE
jgi:hypothetical protein